MNGAKKGVKALNTWAYIEPRGRVTFDEVCIGDNGKAHLARSLHSRRMIGVLGSGLSRSYGQPTWEALLKNTALIVSQKLVDYQTKVAPHRASSLIKNLAKRFTEQRLDKPDEEQKPDLFIYNFELCENLYAELHLCDLEAQEVPSRSDEIFKARALLRSRLKWQLEDHRGRLEIFLRQSFIGSEVEAYAKAETKARSSKKMARVQSEDLGARSTTVIYPRVLAAISFPGTVADRRASVEQSSYAAAFALLFYKDIRDARAVVGAATNAPEELASLLGDVESLKHLRRINRGVLKTFMSAVSVDPGTSARPASDDDAVKFVHLFDTATKVTQRARWDIRDVIDASFIAMPTKRKLAYLEAIDRLATALSRNPEQVQVLRKRARARHPTLLDPIALLHRDLGIRRFVTMNYDAEFDKWLESLDFEEVDHDKEKDRAVGAGIFPTPHGSRSLMADPFGNYAEILAYEPGSAPDLFDFGADTNDRGVHILHLHGRIRKPESWLVLSEPDYQARYARDDEPNARSDDAMRVIFGANPLLFLGLGMTEHDVLRTLRTYSQGELSLNDRPSIALLPQLKDDGETRAQQSRAMSTYGVFNLYYGKGKVKADGAGGDDVAQDEENRHSLKICLDAVDAAAAAVKAALPVIDKTAPVPGRAQGPDDETPASGFVRHLRTADKAFERLAAECFDCPLRLGEAVHRQFVTIEGSKQHALVVNHAIHMAVCLYRTLPKDIDGLEDFSRGDLLVLERLLDNARNVILSSFFCAKLLSIVGDVAAWQGLWGVASRPRESFGQTAVSLTPVGSKLPIESIRHVIILRDLEREVEIRPQQFLAKPDHGPVPIPPRTDRFFAGHPSPAIITLRAALTDNRISTPKSKRMFLLLGARGDGRGHVFAAMRSPRRFAYVCDWLHIPNPNPTRFDGKRARAADYTSRVPRAFYNLGLSHEVISVFDRMTQFLEDILLHIIPAERRLSYLERLDNVRADRIHRLDEILHNLDDLAKDGKIHALDRIVICFNNIDNLFNADGAAKNSQIAKFIDLLISSRYRFIPIDLLMFSSRTPMPAALIELSRETAFQALCADSSTPLQRQRYIDHLNAAGIEWANKDLKPEKPEDEAGWVFTHKLHPMRPVTFALRFFPNVAMALYYLGKRTEGGRIVLDSAGNDTLVNYTFNEDPTVQANLGTDLDGLARRFDRDQQFGISTHLYMQKSIRDAFDKVFINRSGTSDQIKRNARMFTTDVIESLSLALIHNHFDKAKTIISGQHEKLRTVREEFLTGTAQERQQSVDRYHHLMEYFDGKNSKAAQDFLEETIEKYAAGETAWSNPLENMRHYFLKLNSAVGHSRFCLTLVMAALDDMIERRLNSFPEGIVELNPILRFIERLSQACSGQTPHTRVETVIHHVLMNYKTDIFNSYQTPMSAWPSAFRDVHIEQVREDKRLSVIERLFSVEGPAIYELQENILAALSLIGQPVTAEALTGVATVASSFSRLYAAVEQARVHTQQTANHKLSQTEKCRCVELILDLLVHRCLIFRIYPKNNPKGREYHFTVHSSIRRYYLSHMDVPSVDYAAIDQLTVSIYCSQPNDMPKPSYEAYRRIRRLIEGLSQFEDQPAHAFDDPYRETSSLKSAEEARVRETEVDRLRLRAAFGALRSFYSVAVISRFSSYRSEGLPPPEAGYLEAYRRRVRWLLRKAYEMDGPYFPPRDKPASNQNEELYSFYAEEQVWLFNECGVVSLAQGRILDAVGLLIQARIVARSLIEGSQWGGLHVRINLNLAIAHIDAGNLREARQLLGMVGRDLTESEIIRAMAAGYEGRIKSLQGDFTGAQDAFEPAIGVLVKNQRFRAGALLLVHQAENLIELGARHLDAAEDALARARHLSAIGGHEDVGQLEQLVCYRLLSRRHVGRTEKLDRAKIQIGLRPLIDYAKTMNMPRIQSGVALLQAEIFLQHEEFPAASEAAQQALLIATRHSQELVKIDALYVLGASLVKSGMVEARSLLIKARELAIRCDYNAKVTQIDAAIMQTTQRSAV